MRNNKICGYAEDGIPFTTPSYYADISKEKLQHIFRSETPTEIPLLQERMNNLNEVGRVLVKDYKNSFVNMLSQCDNSAKRLLDMITSTFKCFQDESEFNGKRVSFYKRAQILIADIWACFEGQSLGSFKDITVLTMFADYRVPQSLLYLKILRYTDKLMEMLNRGDRVPSGNQIELEIRGNSIWAVEKIYQKIKTMSKMEPELSSLVSEETDSILNSVIIDYYLWDFAKENLGGLTELPFHKTRTIFY